MACMYQTAPPRPLPMRGGSKATDSHTHTLTHTHLHTRTHTNTHTHKQLHCEVRPPFHNNMIVTVNTGGCGAETAWGEAQQTFFVLWVRKAQAPEVPGDPPLAEVETQRFYVGTTQWFVLGYDTDDQLSIATGPMGTVTSLTTTRGNPPEKPRK